MSRQRTLDVPDGVFRGSVALAEEAVTRWQLQSNLYRRLFQDVYIPAGIPVTHEVRCRGVALIAPPEAMLTGRSAAAVYGVELARKHDPVELVVPERFRFGPLRGIRLRRGPITPDEYLPWMGMRLATPSRMALDTLTRHAPRTLSHRRRLYLAVADLDQLIRSAKIDADELLTMLRRRRDHGIALARQAALLADARAESPPESVLRVVLVLAGLAPEPQVEVYDEDGFAGRVDLGFRAEKVAVEYDGHWHDTADQTEFDEHRRGRLRAAGWQVIVVDAERLSNDVPGIVREVKAALPAP